MKLHLGCGGTIKEGYINIDIQEVPGISIDLIHDFRNPLPYEDNTVDEIFCHDVIQLFSRQEWKSIKKDWVRVLKPGGVMETYCHDFEVLLDNFISDKEGQRWKYWSQAIFGGQEDEYDYSKNAFTFEKIQKDLAEEGMEKFSRLSNDTTFLHLTCYKHV